MADKDEAVASSGHGLGLGLQQCRRGYGMTLGRWRKEGVACNVSWLWAEAPEATLHGGFVGSQDKETIVNVIANW